MPIFLISVVISLVGALALFLAGTFTFLAIQVFFEIYANSGIVPAILEVIAGVMLFSCLAFVLMKKGICRVLTAKTGNKSGILQFGTGAKFLASFIIFEVAKFYLKKIRK